MVTIVGQGLVGTLFGLEMERRGQSFRIIDEGSGSTASRAAAGLFNPLTGPRLSPSEENWTKIIPHYRNLEQMLGIGIVFPMVLRRPLRGTMVRNEHFPRTAPGWSAELCPQSLTEKDTWVEIIGGGWVDVSRLLDEVRVRWLRRGILEEREYKPGEGQSQNVWWCCGPRGFLDPRWSEIPGVRGLWQAVRGDVLTVRIPQFTCHEGFIGKRFLLPLGSEIFRWGATHESDISDMGYRDSARKTLEFELREHLGGREFAVIDHRWGIRPASRTGRPIVVSHTDEPGWKLLNGFGGRGVSQLPGFLEKLLF